tara:strand:+ start:5475 stop:6236 length:762 start_codon:yes stop_codon:yes gene_type:complete
LILKDTSSAHFLALHGFTGEGADYSALSSYTGGDWLCADLPGHGSLKDATHNQFSISSIEKQVLARPPSSGYIGIGYSMGGRLLLHLAHRNPDIFKALVLISTSPGLRTERERIERIRSDEKWIRILETTPLPHFLDLWWNQPILASIRNLPATQLNQLREQRLKNSPDGLIRSLQQNGTGAIPSMWEALPDLQMPSLLVVGQSDMKFQKIAKQMKLGLARVRYSVIDQSGHSPHLENPQDTSLAIKDFLQTM